MTPDAAKRIWTELGEKVWARCDCCGFGWKMKRGDAFLCPGCGNEPEKVIFSGARTFVHLPEEQPSWSAWKRL